MPPPRKTVNNLLMSDGTGPPLAARQTPGCEPRPQAGRDHSQEATGGILRGGGLRWGQREPSAGMIRESLEFAGDDRRPHGSGIRAAALPRAVPDRAVRRVSEEAQPPSPPIAPVSLDDFPRHGRLRIVPCRLRFPNGEEPRPGPGLSVRIDDPKSDRGCQLAFFLRRATRPPRPRAPRSRPPAAGIGTKAVSKAMSTSTFLSPPP